MTTSLDQLLIEAIEAMNALTKAVVERSDLTQATAALQAASDSATALAAMKTLIEQTPANLVSKVPGNILKLDQHGKLYVSAEWASVPNW
jgi:hypothetical protein